MAKRWHKKGMNSLVVTILLIAFAVSVGVFVMSFGGNYYKGVRDEKLSCSNALISSFELDNSEGCKDVEPMSIVNFYQIDSSVKAPNCYKEVATGKGDLCIKPDNLFNNTWTKTKNVIK